MDVYTPVSVELETETVGKSWEAMERARLRIQDENIDFATLFDKLLVPLEPKEYIGLIKVFLWLLFEDDTHSSLAWLSQNFITTLILASAAADFVRTYSSCTWVRCDSQTYSNQGQDWRLAELPSGWPAVHKTCDFRPELTDEPISYFIIETIVVSCFTIEYCARLFASTAIMDPLQFFIPPMNLIDLLSIVAYYLELPTRITYMKCARDGPVPCNFTEVDVSFLTIHAHPPSVQDNEDREQFPLSNRYAQAIRTTTWNVTCFCVSLCYSLCSRYISF